MGNHIFEDLEIDHSTMMSDPDSFCEQVYEAADNLKAVLKEENSVDKYLKSVTPPEFNKRDFRQVLNAVYALADSDIHFANLGAAAEMLRKLASDFDYLAKSKAADELGKKQNVMSKSLAHELYSTLREKFNKILEGLETVMGYTNGRKLPPMPGNYGQTVGLIHYLFFFEGEDESYRIPQAVCRRIGIEPMNLMDTLDYIKAHPELNITIKEVSN